MVMISFKSSTDRHPRHSSTTKKDGQYGNIDPSTEIESGNAGEDAPGPDSLTDEERKRIVLEKLRRGDVSLAANKDPHKLAEMEGGDGR